VAGSRLLAQGIDRRRAILRFVKAYAKKNGMAPSIAEIAAGVELSSKTAVRHHLEVLRSEKYVDWIDGKYRSLRITNPDRY
jgi:SOS-response transcriptional repressor LexA